MLEFDQTLQFDAALNSSRSQSLGRRLYQITQQGQDYWLKLHQHGFNAESTQSFIHELQCYAEFKHLEATQGGQLLLPFFIIDVQQYFNVTAEVVDQGLLLQHAPALFATAADQLSHDQLLHIFIQSLSAVAQLHAWGYLHGDLKIEHFRCFNRQCYLIDFEQSIQIEQSKARAQAATPRYMAPELFHGAAKSIQSDIYALGMIWYEWLGQQRIQQLSYLDWAKWHCQNFQVETPLNFKNLESILMRMLSKNKAMRYAHIYEIKQALTSLL